MRWLTPSLLVLSLLFSTGGVAIVGRADSASDALPAAEPKADLPAQCSPAPVARRAPTPARTEPRPPFENKSIVLNTNGYNYPLEGEWHPDPVATPQGVPAGVLPTDLEPTPAAPEAK